MASPAASDPSRPSLASARLVEAARAGDRKAVDELLGRHLSAVRAFVRLNAGPRLREREAQSDLVQSVCREVLENLGALEWQGEPAFRAWLFQTARRKIVDRARYWATKKRAAARELRLDDESGPGALLEQYATFCTPSQEAILHEEQARIERAFTKLSPSHRRVITLARIAGLPHRQIAAELGMNENAVRQLLFRALAHLALLLRSA